MTMRTPIALILVMLVASCSPEPGVPEDDILFHDLVPDVEMQTVRFYTLQDRVVCSTYVPTPADSAVSYDLDLNGDGVNDFRITAGHSKYTQGYCGHCDRFTYNISISGLSDQDSIANSPENYWASRLFSESDTIGAGNTWLSRTEIQLLEGCALPFQADFTAGYLGVKIRDGYGYIRIEKLENNGIRILEQAFNRTPGGQVVCGKN